MNIIRFWKANRYLLISIAGSIGYAVSNYANEVRDERKMRKIMMELLNKSRR